MINSSASSTCITQPPGRNYIDALLPFENSALGDGSRWIELTLGIAVRAIGSRPDARSLQAASPRLPRRFFEGAECGFGNAVENAQQCLKHRIGRGCVAFPLPDGRHRNTYPLCEFL